MSKNKHIIINFYITHKNGYVKMQVNQNNRDRCGSKTF